ncbi:ArsR family transcriptional regulator [Leucobacter exalbidus]|uniref:ArsR family transcriptional regulator n=1 Tax=Leucobacter exalbidus TaxID=662960 RepID=A0A940T3R6_9MICO|nr:metalloregulator ArsR/SmtB family transcription factor [Leucobacter exalbidus]MBP1326054.1 ArsR family transcriptional regulator [Leucobacter exalbidus]
MKQEQRPLYEIKANLFKGLAHPYRIRILEILASAPEASVSEMIAETGLEASHLSQHLAVLRRYGLVTSDRRASVVYYRLAFAQVADLLHVARQLLGEVLNSSNQQLTSLDELPLIAQATTHGNASPAHPDQLANVTGGAR